MNKLAVFAGGALLIAGVILLLVSMGDESTTTTPEQGGDSAALEQGSQSAGRRSKPKLKPLDDEAKGEFDKRQESVKEIRQVMASNNWRRALELSRQALVQDPESKRFKQYAALAACGLKNSDLAREYSADLTGGRYATVYYRCSASGVMLPREPEPKFRKP